MSRIFGSRLKELRGDVSREKFANKYGISPSTWRSWEEDDREPNIDTICKLCDDFEVTSDWLLGRASERRRTGNCKKCDEKDVTIAQLSEANRNQSETNKNLSEIAKKAATAHSSGDVTSSGVGAKVG